MKRAPVFSVTVTALVVAVDLNWKSSGRCSFFFFPLRQEAGLSPDAWQLLLHLEMNSTVFFFYISWLQEAPTQNWRTARSCRSAFLLHIRVASQNGTAEWGVTQWRSWWRNVWTVITFFFFLCFSTSLFFFLSFKKLRHSNCRNTHTRRRKKTQQKKKRRSFLLAAALLSRLFSFSPQSGEHAVCKKWFFSHS